MRSFVSWRVSKLRRAAVSGDFSPRDRKNLLSGVKFWLLSEMGTPVDPPPVANSWGCRWQARGIAMGPANRSTVERQTAPIAGLRRRDGARRLVDGASAAIDEGKSATDHGAIARGRRRWLSTDRVHIRAASGLYAVNGWRWRAQNFGSPIGPVILWRRGNPSLASNPLRRDGSLQPQPNNATENAGWEILVSRSFGVSARPLA
jgi:hypothetical protein